MVDETQESTSSPPLTTTLNWTHLAFTAVVAIIVALAPDVLANQHELVEGIEQICAAVADIEASG